VFFLIDDLGWTDVACYGSDFYETPNIDRLAREGMHFTDAYAACCVCSPTRVSVLTGKYPARLHITHAIPIQGSSRLKGPLPLVPADYCKNLPLEEVTIAEALKPAGYLSASIGKWHVCWEGAYYPEHQGFDLNVAGNNMGNPGTYFHPYQGRWRMTRQHPWIEWRTIEGGSPGEYLTDRLTDEAIAFIAENRDRPFLLYFPHYAVHTPLQARLQLIEKYERKPRGEHHQNPVYAAMIESVDQSVGTVLRRIEKLGLAENTVVIFNSDNGGNGRVTSHHPLRGCKGNFYEGGTRVPLIVKWPGVVQPGSVCRVPVISNDFFPTLLEIAGLPLRPEQHVDGVSLMPLLKQTGQLESRPLFWHFPNYIGAKHPGAARPMSVVRSGDFKLLEFLEDNRVELYNLRKDLGEQHDLADTMPEQAAKLRRLLANWRTAAGVQMPRPNPAFHGDSR
ncbi:MAG: sulfatase, partial [Planctomycetes bacterium]|nr:sulfatase [Planctomycetota bacterium]